MRFSIIITSFACYVVAVSTERKANGSDIEVSENGSCFDREGQVVANGDRFAPDEDPCKTCYCADGVAQLCTLVQCSPPLCAKWEPVRNECCQFRCLDGSELDPDRKSNRSYYRPGDLEGPGFDLRLALSGTTSLLIVALLIFMVHRLRQRRMLIIMNRMAEDQRCIDHDESPFSHDEVAGFDFLAYKDPPPPYSSPHQTLDRRYDPPSYESTTADTMMTSSLLDGRSSSAASTSVTPTISSAPQRDQELSNAAGGLAAFYSHV